MTDLQMTEWREGRILFDDLKLEKAIGEGAFGEVWRARQLSWDRIVAVKRVKVPDKARIKSMEQEAINWLEIGLHPYVTTCYYTRRYEGTPVIVLEYAAEGALDRWIKDERLLFEENGVETILAFSLEAAWGLACAHRTGLLHLDVKPANILIENGLAKITDFGIASRLGQELSSSGTLAFAPPEQLAREDVSEKADVFSWAVTVFALFRHDVSWTVGLAAPEILQDEWELGTLPLNMPEPVYKLLLRCMEEDPALRPTMEEAADELAACFKSFYPDFAMPVKAIDRQPLSAAEYNNRAVYMHETGEKDSAYEYFKKSVDCAADITVPQFNKSLADFYAGKVTPGKLMEDLMNRELGEKEDERCVAARIMMLNGDARSIDENPDLVFASHAAEEWLAAGAPGSLAIEAPHTAKYLQEGDREKTRKILTQGGLSAFNRNINKLPVDFIISPQRKTLMLDNDKGAILLGGLNSKAKPWTTCMIFHDKLKLQTAQFLGENAVLFVDNGLEICDFSDPENLIFTRMPDTPELRALGDVALARIECLDNVSCIVSKSRTALFAVVILDHTYGIDSARVKVVQTAPFPQPDVAFCKDGSVLINGQQRIFPEEWGGERRITERPDDVLPSNNTNTPRAKIFGNFGQATTLIRHSQEYHDISDKPDTEAFEYACRYKFSPYRFLAMAYDDQPADGGSLLLENEGEFYVSRIDKGDIPPPNRVEWLMMKAVSGAVAKSRRDTVKQAEADYDRLIMAGAVEEIENITAALRPLLESRDENALALWQRIARDFPRGDVLFCTEGAAVKDQRETAFLVRSPKPLFPAMPFSRNTAIGKVRFSYRDTNWNTQADTSLIVNNGRTPPREFPSVGLCRYAVSANENTDGLFQCLVYAQQGEDGKLIIGRRGTLVRVFDIREPECVLEIYRPGLQVQELFVRWTYHTLLLYLGGEGMYAINFDKVKEPVTELSAPVIPHITTLYDVNFMGEHEDELFTGENRWKFYYDILPFPENPAGDARLAAIQRMLPRRPQERRAMLLQSGFGNLWTDSIIGIK